MKRKAIGAVWLILIVSSLIMTYDAYANRVIQRWAVPDGVTKIQVTYKDQFGRVLARQDMEVQPRNIFEVIPLQ